MFRVCIGRVSFGLWRHVMKRKGVSERQRESFFSRNYAVEGLTIFFRITEFTYGLLLQPARKG
jgi:hypothetical protein